METKYIVSLREEINTGTGVTKRLEVGSYQADALVLPSFIEFVTVDGKTILVNKNNVRSIMAIENK